MQINLQAVDVNKYRYIQTPMRLLIFEVIGHVYTVQCEVLNFEKYQWTTSFKLFSPVENQNDLELDFKVFFFVDSCC